MDEMGMALEMMAAMEELSVDDFIAEYNRVTAKSIGIIVKKEDIKWNGFPVYYNPDD